jgi:hypothetical protein
MLDPSLPGLTRQIHPLRKRSFASGMDARFKSAHDTGAFGNSAIVNRQPSMTPE